MTQLNHRKMQEEYPYNLDICLLNLSVYITGCIRRSNIKTLGELLLQTGLFFEGIRGIGENSTKEICAMIELYEMDIEEFLKDTIYNLELPNSIINRLQKEKIYDIEELASISIPKMLIIIGNKYMHDVVKEMERRELFKIEEEELKYFMKFSKRTLESLLYAGICKKADMEKFGLKNYKQ